MNFFPLCTARVCPTMSGMIVDRRDHVFTTLRSFRLFISSTLLRSGASTNGPLEIERAIAYLACFLRRTMNLSVRGAFRVFFPLVGTPQGVHDGRPPDVRPSPPPCGWSTGFIATPRTVGLRPRQRVRPAFPTLS